MPLKNAQTFLREDGFRREANHVNSDITQETTAAKPQQLLFPSLLRKRKKFDADSYGDLQADEVVATVAFLGSWKLLRSTLRRNK